MSWTDFETWTKSAMSIGGAIILFLASGKVLRVNRIDKANTNAQVAGIRAEETAAESVTASLKRLQDTVNEQSGHITELRDEVSQLRNEIHGLNNRRSAALDILEEIKLCGECEAKYGAMLRTAIKTLKEQEHAG